MVAANELNMADNFGPNNPNDTILAVMECSALHLYCPAIRAQQNSKKEQISKSSGKS